MCFENQVVFYKCWQLINLGKNFLHWFFNNTLHVKIDENGSIFKIYCSHDLENLLQVVNIDKLINNSSSWSHTMLKHGINSWKFYDTSTFMSTLFKLLIWWIILSSLLYFYYISLFIYSISAIHSIFENSQDTLV